jgi:hypothetical protein
MAVDVDNTGVDGTGRQAPMNDEFITFARVIGVSSDSSEQLATVRDQTGSRRQSAVAV